MTVVRSSGIFPSEIGQELVMKHRSETSFRRDNDKDKTHLKCSHCGGSRHIKEGCFKIVGYPEWWNEFRAATKAPSSRTGDKAHLATSTSTNGPQNQEEGLSFEPNDRRKRALFPVRKIAQIGDGEREKRGGAKSVL